VQQHGHDKQVPKSQSLTNPPGLGRDSWSYKDVGDVKRFARSDDLGRRKGVTERGGKDALHYGSSFVAEVVVSGELHQASIKAEESTVHCATEPHCTSHDAIEHGLDVGRRAADDAQNLARRGLLLASLS